jgi:hypothetical protein
MLEACLIYVGGFPLVVRYQQTHTRHCLYMFSLFLKRLAHTLYTVLLVVSVFLMRI